MLSGGLYCSAENKTVPHPAAQFSLSNLDGKKVSLEGFKGHWIVLEWFNTDCMYVQEYYGKGRMQKWQGDYTAKGVVWLAICSSAQGQPGQHADAELRKSLLEFKMKVTDYLCDENGEVARLYGVKSTPTVVVISPQLEIVYFGAIESTASIEEEDIKKADNYLLQTLDAALAGKGVSYKKTRTYGCSIKFKDATRR